MGNHNLLGYCHYINEPLFKPMLLPFHPWKNRSTLVPPYSSGLGFNWPQRSRIWEVSQVFDRRVNHWRGISPGQGRTTVLKPQMVLYENMRKASVTDWTYNLPYMSSTENIPNADTYMDVYIVWLNATNLSRRAYGCLCLGCVCPESDVIKNTDWGVKRPLYPFRDAWRQEAITGVEQDTPTTPHSNLSR